MTRPMPKPNEILIHESSGGESAIALYIFVAALSLGVLAAAIKPNRSGGEETAHPAHAFSIDTTAPQTAPNIVISGSADSSPQVTVRYKEREFVDASIIETVESVEIHTAWTARLNEQGNLLIELKPKQARD